MFWRIETGAVVLSKDDSPNIDTHQVKLKYNRNNLPKKPFANTRKTECIQSSATDLFDLCVLAS